MVIPDGSMDEWTSVLVNNARLRLSRITPAAAVPILTSTPASTPPSIPLPREGPQFGQAPKPAPQQSSPPTPPRHSPHQPVSQHEQPKMAASQHRPTTATPANHASIDNPTSITSPAQSPAADLPPFIAVTRIPTGSTNGTSGPEFVSIIDDI